MAAKQIILTYSTAASLEIEIIQLSTNYIMDNADGVFKVKASIISPRVPVPETAVAGVYEYSENRQIWPDGNYLIVVYLTGQNNAIDSKEMYIINDGESVPPIPGTDDLATLADVKSWLSIATGNTNSDAVLTRLITAVSRVIETYLSRKIKTANYVETRNGNGRTSIMLRNYPLTAIASIAVDGMTVPARLSPLSSGYVFDDSMIYLSGYAFNRGYQNIQVLYTAGYDIIPADIVQACIECVSFRFKERERIGQASKSIGGEVISYTVTDLPKNVRMILDQFKNVVPVI